jgi:hypothetical protein
MIEPILYLKNFIEILKLRLYLIRKHKLIDKCCISSLCDNYLKFLTFKREYFRQIKLLLVQNEQDTLRNQIQNITAFENAVTVTLLFTSHSNL